MLSPSELQRRRLVAACVPAALFAAGARGAAVEERRLGADWRLPPKTTIEIAVTPELSLSQALDAIAAWSIPVNARVIIRLPDGEHEQTNSLRFRHRDGERVSIVGNSGRPDRCRLLWNGPDDALVAGAGTVLGMLDGVSLVHAARSRRGKGSAVLADEGGMVLCGPSVRVDGFYYAFQARRNGVIRASGTSASGGGDANYFAFMGGHITARGASASRARDPDRSLGSGFVAEYGGSIDAERASSVANLLDGYTALSGGSIRAYHSRAERNGRAGFFADTGGRIVAHDSSARANCGSGIATQDGPRGITGNRISTVDNNASPEACPSR